MQDVGKPKWAEDEALRKGREAHRLAEGNRALMEPRLDAGIIDGLGADIELLSASDADRKVAKTTQKGKTGKKRDTAEEGRDLVAAVRDSATRTRGISPGTLKELGVGERMDPSSAATVVAGVNACLTTFKEDPTLAGKIGVIPQDVEEMRAIVTSLDSAALGQVDAMATSKDKTFDRNAVQMRIEAAVDMISARGRLAFRNDTDMRERFEALVCP